MNESVNEPSYQIHTLGCKANFSDSQVLESKFLKEGLKYSASDPGVIVVNTCAVTEEADRQSKRLAKRLAKKHPNARVLMTGCGADVNAKEFKKLESVSAVIGNKNRNDIMGWVLNQSTVALGKDPEILSRHPIDQEWPLPQAYFDPEHSPSDLFRTRAFLKVQEGCNSFCTFCIIPYGRGPARSLSPDTIVDEVTKIELSGVKEIILTGTNIGHYGIDFHNSFEAGKPLAELLRKILEETSIPRIRVSSMDPIEINPWILKVFKESEGRICPHFHVSLQSSDTHILRLMKRRYSQSEVAECLHAISELRDPVSGLPPFVGMDVIAGFPGETDEIFDRIYSFLANSYWSRLHVFPYSERKNTPATRLKGVVKVETRRSRTKALMNLSLQRLTKQSRMRLMNSFDDLLTEGQARGPDGTRNWRSGYTRDYRKVLILDSGQISQNEILSVKPTQMWVDEQAGEVAFLVL